MNSPSLLSIAVIKCGLKSAWKERIYFSLQLTVHYQWKLGLELEAGTWRQELKLKLWRSMTYQFPHLGSLGCFLYGARAGTTHSGLALAPSIINQ